MATDNKISAVTVDAGADFSTTGQFRAVKINASGEAVLCNVEGEVAYGILQNNPGLGDVCTVAISGITKAEAGGAIAAGDAVTVDVSGRVMTVAPATGETHRHIGIARTAAGAAGEIISVDFRTFAGSTSA